MQPLTGNNAPVQNVPVPLQKRTVEAPALVALEGVTASPAPVVEREAGFEDGLAGVVPPVPLFERYCSLLI